jgi:hypothetical protein
VYWRDRGLRLRLSAGSADSVASPGAALARRAAILRDRLVRAKHIQQVAALQTEFIQARMAS